MKRPTYIQNQPTNIYVNVEWVSFSNILSAYWLGDQIEIKLSAALLT